MESPSCNLFSVFRRHFPGDLSTPLLTTAAGEVFSYDDALQHSARVANALLAQGLVPGDRVTAQVEKSPEALWLYLGVLRAGLVFHPLNTAYTEQELAYFVDNAAPAAIVCDPAREAMFRSLTGGRVTLLTLDAAGEGSLVREAASAATDFRDAETRTDDLAALLYSSGTTGRPKGIMLTHGNLVDNARVLVKAWGFSAEDCLLHALPIFHVHGLFVAIGCVLMSGARMRWLPGFDATAVLEQLPRCSVMMGVPTYYTRLLAAPELTPARCERMRLFVSGSAPLLASTFHEFRQRTGHTILERYGMSETGMITTNPLEGERRAGTVGLPLAGQSVRIVDAAGHAVEPGEVGVIQVRGPNVFAGYWQMPEKTAEDFTSDGYFITGDQGRCDSDGYIAIVGRARDMVISGGLNVYPKEIELLIDQLEGVSESAVIGVPDSDLGEAVTALVVPVAGARLEAAEVIAHVKARAANFKVPKRVYFLDSLPRNTMGKVQKNRLRERYAETAPPAS